MVYNTQGALAVATSPNSVKMLSSRGGSCRMAMYSEKSVSDSVSNLKQVVSPTQKKKLTFAPSVDSGDTMKPEQSYLKFSFLNSSDGKDIFRISFEHLSDQEAHEFHSNGRIIYLKECKPYVQVLSDLEDAKIKKAEAIEAEKMMYEVLATAKELAKIAEEKKTVEAMEAAEEAKEDVEEAIKVAEYATKAMEDAEIIASEALEIKKKADGYKDSMELNINRFQYSLDFETQLDETQRCFLVCLDRYEYFQDDISVFTKVMKRETLIHQYTTFKSFRSGLESFILTNYYEIFPNIKDREARVEAEKIIDRIIGDWFQTKKKIEELKQKDLKQKKLKQEDHLLSYIKSNAFLKKYFSEEVLSDIAFLYKTGMYSVTYMDITPLQSIAQELPKYLRGSEHPLCIKILQYLETIQLSDTKRMFTFKEDLLEIDRECASLLDLLRIICQRF